MRTDRNDDHGRRDHNHGGNNINDHDDSRNVNIDIDDDYLDHVAVDHVKFTDDDGADHVYVRRVDLDNLARVIDDGHVRWDQFDDAARRLLNNAILHDDKPTADTAGDDAALHAYLHQRALRDAEYGATKLRDTARAYLAGDRAE